jgi:hypothetical protein
MATEEKRQGAKRRGDSGIGRGWSNESLGKAVSDDYPETGNEKMHMRPATMANQTAQRRGFLKRAASMQKRGWAAVLTMPANMAPRLHMSRE